jgi:hypothetical protein
MRSSCGSHLPGTLAASVPELAGTALLGAGRIVDSERRSRSVNFDTNGPKVGLIALSCSKGSVQSLMAQVQG